MIEVVIPAHNAEAFLRETIESVAEQTRPPARVTVVNDRSRDATRALAFGDCYVFDSDTGAIRLASHHAKCGLFDLQAEDAPLGGRRRLERDFPVQFRGLRVPTSASLLRRDTALAAGLFDESMTFAEDADLFVRLAWLGAFRFTSRGLLRKRAHGNNLTHESNQLHFSRGGALVALKCLAIARAACPAPCSPRLEDRRLVEALAPRAVDHCLYSASCAGFGAFA